jgi:hypothetical protein
MEVSGKLHVSGHYTPGKTPPPAGPPSAAALIGQEARWTSEYIWTTCDPEILLPLTFDDNDNRSFSSSSKGGRTRTDKIGVGAGDDIGGTDIWCNFMARQYTRPTRQSYRNDHRHVGVMPATPR